MLYLRHPFENTSGSDDICTSGGCVMHRVRAVCENRSVDVFTELKHVLVQPKDDSSENIRNVTIHSGWTETREMMVEAVAASFSSVTNSSSKVIWRRSMISFCAMACASARAEPYAEIS
jgi:hypothetical protein